ncbi:MAG: hypothetical protein ABJC10_09235 [Acidobacteriota bacterium]
MKLVLITQLMMLNQNRGLTHGDPTKVEATLEIKAHRCIVGKLVNSYPSPKRLKRALKPSWN